MTVFLFLALHWYLAAFSQSFFLHRYSAHKMFTMSYGWERFFYFMTFFTQGSSYLNPRAYAVMHRMHHAHSDTAKDPHSPVYYPDVVRMMWSTLKMYLGIFYGTVTVPREFEGDYPVWKKLDRIADSPAVRIGWIIFYVLFYVKFSVSPWQYLLIPLHVFMGPVHGAIVNWCGHKYGYTNFDNRDQSKNTFFWDIFTMGELMQNNHHRHGLRPNFAVKWFEFDPTYIFIRLLNKMRVIRLRAS